MPPFKNDVVVVKQKRSACGHSFGLSRAAATSLPSPSSVAQTFVKSSSPPLWSIHLSHDALNCTHVPQLHAQERQRCQWKAQHRLCGLRYTSSPPPSHLNVASRAPSVPRASSRYGKQSTQLMVELELERKHASQESTSVNEDEASGQVLRTRGTVATRHASVSTAMGENRVCSTIGCMGED